jgi:hypothetical protein
MMHKKKSHKIEITDTVEIFQTQLSVWTYITKLPIWGHGQNFVRTWPLLLCWGQCRMRSDVLFSHALCIYLGILIACLTSMLKHELDESKEEVWECGIHAANLGW